MEGAHAGHGDPDGEAVRGDAAPDTPTGGGHRHPALPQGQQASLLQVPSTPHRAGQRQRQRRRGRRGPLLPSQLLAEPQEAEQQREVQQQKEHIEQLCGGDAETLIRNI